MYNGYEYGSGGGAGFGGGGFGGFEGMGGGDNHDTGGGFLEGGTKSAEKKSRDRQSLLPVTIKQLSQAKNDGDSFKIDDVELHTVKIIGFIESIQSHSTHHLYTINDGSGVIECKEWIEKESTGPPKEVDFRENTYVRVFGNLREYEGRTHILIYNITPLQDWNELTNHLLEVVFTHLQNTRGTIPGTSSVSTNLNTPFRGVGAPPTQQSGGYNNSHNNMSVSPGMNNPYAASGGGSGGGGGYNNNNNNSQQVEMLFDVVRNISNPEGAHVNDIMRGLNQRGVKLNMPELKKMLSICLEQGTMYAGSDDDRYCVI